MRVLGLDIGEKRIGVAVSDPVGAVATPLTVLDAKKALGDGRDLLKIVDEYQVESVVVGLPLSLDGSEGPQARRVRNLANRLAMHLNIPMEFTDERYSSSEARRSMTASGVSSRGQRGSVDKVAAAIFLQSYLDAQREPGNDSD